MQNITISTHLEADTGFRVTPFAKPHPFVCLRLEGEFSEIALLAAPGSAESLRRLATAAIEAAEALDAMADEGPEVTGRD
ncbi:hypothetical protein [Streptomyces luteolus]|uniref:Uncharacterized protein n=1 Tax=Streptomyces luteolus TaxID=3043615 RepID=A0ABT6SSM0_9ACTN|nr:hypothetical protein [Streptomyces sp. B-S-A12]MDI3418571.1 hypothetical protein [Streptomyces sp. B-S-A12]